MVLQSDIWWLWTASIFVVFHFASAQLASFQGGFLNDLTGGLQTYGVESPRRGLDLLQLIRRQQAVCPSNAPVDCGARGCCLAGQYCCTNVNVCCKVNSNCYSSPKGCCPKAYETCGKGLCLLPGQTCCSTGACNQGYVCLKSPGGRETCCLPGMSACEDGNCCYAGTKCSISKPGKCEAIRSTPSASTSPSTFRAARSSPAQQPSPISQSISSPRPPKHSKSSKLNCKSTPSYSIPNIERAVIPEHVRELPQRSVSALTLFKRQDESVSGFEDFCETDDGKIPVMLFPWFPGETDELIESTCKGISEFGGIDELLLTWAGDGPAGAKKRRRKNCPPGYCSSIREKQNTNYPRKNECDEFPPASSVESAQGSHVMCIDELQNQLGGKLIQTYRWLYDLQPQQKFIVRVVPTCGSFASTIKNKRLPANSYDQTESVQKRAVANKFSGSNSSWLQDRRPGARSGVGWVFGSLPELSAGTYNISFGFDGPVLELSVFDSAGLEYLRLSSASPGQAFNFTVVDGLPLAVAAYAREDAKIELSYKGQNVVKSTKTSFAVAIRGSSDICCLSLGFMTLGLFGLAW